MSVYNYFKFVIILISGDFGRYQCFQFVLHILAAMTAGMHMLSLVTVAAVPEHRYGNYLLSAGSEPTNDPFDTSSYYITYTYVIKSSFTSICELLVSLVSDFITSLFQVFVQAKLVILVQIFEIFKICIFYS